MRAATRRLVTADLGNSACKLALWSQFARDGAPERVVSFPTDAELGAHALAACRAFAGVGRIAVSSVASPAIELELVSALSTIALVVRPASGLRIDVEAPSALGSDRAFAARGAFELVRGPAIVVDAGTALTVDVLDVEYGAPVFRGGSIAPGPALLARSLAEHTARLPRIDPSVGPHALGRDTAAAIDSGIVHGFRGAAAELARAIGAEAGIERSPVVVTGGARAFLLEPTSCFHASVLVDAHLVHRGLLAAALELEPSS